MIDDSTGLFKVKASVENGDALPTGSTTKLPSFLTVRIMY